MGNPPYNTDLSPNNFFLFEHIKNELRGQRFSVPEEVCHAFKNHVLEVLHSEWNENEMTIGLNANVLIIMENKKNLKILKPISNKLLSLYY